MFVVGFVVMGSFGFLMLLPWACLLGWGGGVVGIFALFSGFAGGSGALWLLVVGWVLGLFVVPCWRV
jgi:hypothetical protein